MDTMTCYTSGKSNIFLYEISNPQSNVVCSTIKDILNLSKGEWLSSSDTKATEFWKALNGLQ